MLGNIFQVRDMQTPDYYKWAHNSDLALWPCSVPLLPFRGWCIPHFPRTPAPVPSAQPYQVLLLFAPN